MCGQALLNGSGSAFVPFLCLHVQDGADIRMRSPDDEDPRAFMCRSRSSNVLDQVVTLYTNFERVSIPMELVPLGSKSADTLVTALDKALKVCERLRFSREHRWQREVCLERRCVCFERRGACLERRCRPGEVVPPH